MLDFVDTSHDGLVQQLGCPSILSQGGASSWLEAIAAEMHRRTWFTMAGDGQPVQTRRGSRPGSTFADLMFSAGISAIMSVKEQLRMNTPGVLPKPSVPWDGRRDLSACEIPSYQIELGEIVWADDVAECLAFPKADQAIGQTAKSASILAEAFATFGYTLTFGATKTAALIKAQGDGSRQVRGALFRGKATLPVLLETSAPAALPLVAAYKHLGVMQTGGLSMLPELRQRCGSAWAAFRQGRKAVYRNRRLTLHKRGILLTSAVLSRLFYGAGAWHTLRVGEERVVNGTMLNILRQTLCVPHAEDQHVCRAEMCALLGVPDPCTCMRVERLRYVRQAVAAAPDVPWALMRLDSALMAAYRDAFRWLFQALRATTTLPDPLVEWDPWLKVMCASPGRFRGWTKRAKRLAVLRLTCGAALSALARAVRQVGQAREPTLRVPGATAYTEKPAFLVASLSARGQRGPVTPANCMAIGPRLPCLRPGSRSTGAELAAKFTRVRVGSADIWHIPRLVRMRGGLLVLTQGFQLKQSTHWRRLGSFQGGKLRLVGLRVPPLCILAFLTLSCIYRTPVRTRSGQRSWTS